MLLVLIEPGWSISCAVPKYISIVHDRNMLTD